MDVNPLRSIRMCASQGQATASPYSRGYEVAAAATPDARTLTRNARGRSPYVVRYSARPGLLVRDLR